MAGGYGLREKQGVAAVAGAAEGDVGAGGAGGEGDAFQFVGGDGLGHGYGGGLQGFGGDACAGFQGDVELGGEVGEGEGDGGEAFGGGGGGHHVGHLVACGRVGGQVEGVEGGGGGGVGIPVEGGCGAPLAVGAEGEEGAGAGGRACPEGELAAGGEGGFAAVTTAAAVSAIAVGGSGGCGYRHRGGGEVGFGGVFPGVDGGGDADAFGTEGDAEEVACSGFQFVGVAEVGGEVASVGQGDDEADACGGGAGQHDGGALRAGGVEGDGDILRGGVIVTRSSGSRRSITGSIISGTGISIIDGDVSICVEVVVSAGVHAPDGEGSACEAGGADTSFSADGEYEPCQAVAEAEGHVGMVFIGGGGGAHQVDGGETLLAADVEGQGAVGVEGGGVGVIGQQVYLGAGGGIVGGLLGGGGAEAGGGAGGGGEVAVVEHGGGGGLGGACGVEAEADGVSGCPFVVDDAGGGDACREAHRYWLFTVPCAGGVFAVGAACQ